MARSEKPRFCNSRAGSCCFGSSGYLLRIEIVRAYAAFRPFECQAPIAYPDDQPWLPCSPITECVGERMRYRRRGAGDACGLRAFEL